jgi:hypothetical protein
VGLAIHMTDATKVPAPQSVSPTRDARSVPDK